MKDETATALEEIIQLCMTKQKAVDGVEAMELVHIRSVLHHITGHIEMLVDVWEGNPRPTPRLTVPPLRKGSLTSKFKPLVGLTVRFGSDREK